MHFATYEGFKVGYQKSGQGPALVMLHGTGGDGDSNWQALEKTLSNDHLVLRPDYAGSGQTQDDGRPLTINYLAEQILAAIDHANIDKFILVGFSLGAVIAMSIAASHPNRIENLILIAGFAKTDPRLKVEFELWRDLIATDREAMARLILLTGFSPDTLSSWGNEDIENAVKDIVKNQNWQGMLRQIELDLTIDAELLATRVASPTMVIGCTHDHMVSPKHAKRLVDLIKGAIYCEIPTGHLAPMENPELVEQKIRYFLSGH